MTAAPSIHSLLPRDPANRDGSASHKPAPGILVSNRPARGRRGPRGLLVVCLTLLAALASAGFWLDAPPATQDAVRYVDGP